MTTLGALKAEIINDIPRAAGDSTALSNKIAAALRHYNRSRFYFNTIDTTDIVAVIGQVAYTGAAEVVRLDSVFRIRDNDIVELVRAFDNEFEQWSVRSLSNGAPTDYSYVNKSLRIYPAPDYAYTIRLHGHFKVPGPATDDEADNPWMIEAYDLIKARALWDLWSTTWQGADGGESQSAKMAEMEQLGILEAETNMRNGTGVLVSTEF